MSDIERVAGKILIFGVCMLIWYIVYASCRYGWSDEKYPEGRRERRNPEDNENWWRIIIFSALGIASGWFAVQVYAQYWMFLLDYHGLWPWGYA